MSMKESYESPKPDNLFAANQVMPVVTGKVTLKTPAKRGALVSTDGNADQSDKEIIKGIAAEDGEAGDTIALYLTGEFNADAINAVMSAPLVEDGEIIMNRIFIKSNQTA